MKTRKNSVSLFILLVLLFIAGLLSAFTTNQSATLVIGQTNFTNNTANQGGAVGANTLNQGTNVWVYGMGLAVGDFMNNRVLLYNSIPSANNANADVVVGQTNMTSNAANQGGAIAANTLSGPLAAVSDGTRLFIADRSNNRVLIYNSLPVTNNAPANLVIGQPNMTTGTVNTGGIGANTLQTPRFLFTVGGKLLISDSDNNRVLIYNSLPVTNNAPADVVIGQTNFTNNGANQGGIGANTLQTPRGIYSDGTKLFIADSGNNRVLIYNTIPVANNASANVVIGQTNFTNNGVNQGGIGANTLNQPIGVYSDGVSLYIGDTSNNRTLIYNTIPVANNASANEVIGQTNFTNNGANQGGIGANTQNGPYGVFAGGTNLYVGDYLNHRILIYGPTPTPTGTAIPACFTSPNLDLKVRVYQCVADRTGYELYVKNNDPTTAVKLSDLTIKVWAYDTSAASWNSTTYYNGGLYDSGGGSFQAVTSPFTLTTRAYNCTSTPGHLANWELDFTNASTQTILTNGGYWLDGQFDATSSAGAFVPGLSSWYSQIPAGQVGGCTTTSNNPASYTDDLHYALYYQGKLVNEQGGADANTGVVPCAALANLCTATVTRTATNTPTNTPSNTPTRTPTNTSTNTPTNSPTPTPTNTPTNSPTPTPTNTLTATPSSTPTGTPTRTPTPTATNSPTNTPSNTPTPTPTPTSTPTLTATKTPTNSPTNTPTLTPTNTSTPTATNSPTPTATKTPTNSPTNSPSNTPTNSPTNTPTPTATNSPTPTPTLTPTSTATSTATNSPTPTATNSPTNTPTNTPTLTPTRTPTNTPTPTATNSSTPTATNSPTPTATSSPTNTPSNSPTHTPTPTATNSPTLTATLTPTRTATNSPTPTATSSPSNTPTPTATNSPTPTPTLTPTNSPTATPTTTSSYTHTNTPTNSPTNTSTKTPTNSPSDTPSNSPTKTPTPTATGTPTSTATHSPSNTPTLTPTNSATATPTLTETKTATNSPTDTPTNSPTNTPTPTATPSPTPTATNSPTNTPSNTPTNSPTPTATHSPTPTATNSPTPTATNSPSNSPTMTPTNSPTATPTSTATHSPTVTPTDTPTTTSSYTHTNTPTNSPSNTPTKTPTNSPSDTPSNTPTLTPTDTATATPTSTATHSPTPTATDSPTPTATNSPSDTPTLTPTNTLTPTATHSPTVTPTDTPTTTSSYTHTNTPTNTPTLTPTKTPTDSMTPTASLTATASPTSSPTNSPTKTPSNSPTPTPTNSPTVTSTLSPTNTASNTPSLTPTDSPTVTPTFTATVTPTDTFTSTPTFTGTLTPSVTIVPTADCTQEKVSIFDERGELIQVLCGNLPSMASQPLTFTLSNFQANANGSGGTLTLLLNGHTVAVWDGKDQNGNPVPSSFYHLILYQKFTDGSSAQMEKDVFIPTDTKTTGLQLSAAPNLARPGDTVQVTAVFGIAPADKRSSLKVYTVSGELVRNLPVSNGQAAWDLTNNQGSTVGSGVYLVVLDGVDVTNGAPAKKVIKVVVLR